MKASNRYKNTYKKNSSGVYKPVIDYVFMGVLALFLIIAPFFRGLYFRENYLPAIAMLSVIFVLYVVYRLVSKDFHVIGSKLDYAIFGLFTAYLISFFFSANSFTAYDSILIYASYFMMYIMAANITSSYDKIKAALYISVASIFVIAFSGHLVYADIINLKGAMEYNRLYGLYQYPNATGSVLGAGALICISYLPKCANKWESILIHIALTTIFSAFVLTLSVGAFLTFAAVIMIYFIVTKVKGKLYIMLASATMLLSCLPLLYIFIRGTYKQSFVIMYIISLIMSGIFGWLINYLNNKGLRDMDPKKSLKIVLATVVLVLFLSVALFFGFRSSIEPAVSKLWDEELKSQNAQDRITFTKDGFRIFTDNILFGAGGGAWKDQYFRYQSFPYPSAEAHNYYIQLMVETGLAGLIALIAVLYFVLKKGIKTILTGDKQASASLFLAVIMLLGHAVLDFDLSLSALMFLLMFIIGAVSGEREERISNSSISGVFNFVVPVMAILVFILSFTMWRGINYGVDAANTVEQNMDAAETLYEKAIRYDPFNSAYRIDYSQIMAVKHKQTNDKKYLDRMIETINDIMKNEPNNIKYYPTMISLLLSNGMIDRGVEMANNMVLIRPFSEDAYSTKIQVNLDVAKAYFNNKDYEGALVFMDNILECESQMREAESRSIKPFQFSDEVCKTIEETKKWKEDTEKLLETVSN